MEGKEFSLKSLINKSIESTNGRCRKIFASSLIQYVLFLVVYFLTRSLLISFIVYATFIPSQIKFLSNLSEDVKAEKVYKIGSAWLTSLLISMTFVFIFGFGLVALIFPAIIFFSNYILVFSISSENGVLNTYKEAKEKAKGYRGKLALLSLIFLLLLVLFIGLGILIAWLFSLIIPALNYNSAFVYSFLITPLFYYVGTFIGVSLFMIFVMPLEMIVISNIEGEIAQDKLFRENCKEESETAEPKIDEEVEGETEKIKPEDLQIKEPNDALDDSKKDDGNPTDYIF